ncbi:MlaC/ttg2D family ABC transporter substrate-binding protein [Sneathiella chinensis]|nr:ABC transporter substrate-binding protein [Sneathiella chinensis]
MKLCKALSVPLVATFLAASPLAIMPSPTGAQAVEAAEQQAINLVDQLGQRAVKLLSDGSLDEDAKREGFSNLVNDGFDMDLIGKFVLGKYRRQTSPEQLQEFLSLFDTYMITTYQKRIGEYAGENLEILKAKPLNKKEILVNSQIIRPAGPPIKLDWRVRKSNSGDLKIIDLIVENVSMAITHRDEFSSVISNNGKGVDGLIETLKSHIAAAQ